MAIDIFTKSILESAKILYSPSSLLLDAFARSLREKQEPDDIVDLRVEVERRQLEMRMAESEARVAQELAIARRIETAHEVEMTEYFDYSGEGHLGIKVGAESINAGAGGSGRRVSKRKFVFKGGVALDNITVSAEQDVNPVEATVNA